MNEFPDPREHPTDDELADLVRAAGAPPPAPEAFVSEAYAAALETFETEIRAPRERRWWRHGVLVAATLALVVGTGLLLRVRGSDEPPAGLVAGPVARVVVGSLTGADRSWTAGDLLPAGTTVDVPGSAPAALHLSEGASVRVDRGSRIGLPGGDRIDLERGAVYVDSLGRSVEIRTPAGIVHNTGTRFEVRWLASDDQLRIRVRSGSVSLTAEGERQDAEAGEELRVTTDGETTRRPVTVWGADWDWTLDAAPAFPLAGRTLGEFLDWVAAETGWEVRLPDEDSDLRDEVMLQGSIEGLTVPQAVESVLEASGFRYRREDGTLIVEPVPSSR